MHAIHVVNCTTRSVVTPYNNIVLAAIVTLVVHCMGKPLLLILCLCSHKRSGNAIVQLIYCNADPMQ